LFEIWFLGFGIFPAQFSLILIRPSIRQYLAFLNNSNIVPWLVAPDCRAVAPLHRCTKPP
jgi:hypothetical protein